tara:strand:+ start:834 stop:1586 length:753 start_codon:yes stop_codon:yes gene_type:complete
MDSKTHDKDGNPLNLMPKANRLHQASYYDTWLTTPERYEPTPEDIKCELQLQALGNFEQLCFNFNYEKFTKEIENFEFVPYLRREGITNDRDGLMLVGLEGDKSNDSLSRPEAIARAGRHLEETDFTFPTDAYIGLTSLHEVLDYWGGLGRTMIVKSNKGGWFPPHRDAPQLTRDCFRVIVFLGPATDFDAYEWYLGDERRVIIPNTAYYVDTRKVHRTHAWADDSYHLVLNVPKTWPNVLKLMSKLRHY